MKKIVLSLILILMLATAGHADSLSLGFFQSSTDNLFQNRYPEEDLISNLSFSFSKDFYPFSFFADGTYSYLYQNSNVSYYIQDIGLDYLHAFNEKTAAYFSVKGSGALYREINEGFNYLSLSLIGAVKTYLTDASILKSNYTFDYKNYRYSMFDYLSHMLNLSLDRYFETRTTVKAELNWGYKFYLHPYLSQEIPPEVDPYYPRQAGRGWRHFGGGPFEPPSSPPPLENEGEGIQILSLSGLLAQGLGEKVGLRVSGLRQWTLSGENPFSSVEEFYLVENPTYDIFSWNGYSLSAQLTLEAPWNTQLKISYTILDREFPGIESLNLDGTSQGMIREDQRNQWDLRIEKNFSSFSIYFSYSYIINSSNDAYFDWNGNFISAGFEWLLPLGGRK